MTQSNNSNEDSGALTLGQKFRVAREARGDTPSEVAKATHMMIKHVVSMEEDDYSAMGPAIYVKGFLKIYADYLGMNPEDVVQEYNGRTNRSTSHPGLGSQSRPPVPPRAPRQSDFGKNVQKNVQKNLKRAVSSAKGLPSRIPKKTVRTWAINGGAALVLVAIVVGLLLGIRGCFSLAGQRSAAKQRQKRAESAYIQEPAEPYINDIK